MGTKLSRAQRRIVAAEAALCGDRAWSRRLRDLAPLERPREGLVGSLGWALAPVGAIGAGLAVWGAVRSFRGGWLGGLGSAPLGFGSAAPAMFTCIVVWKLLIEVRDARPAGWARPTPREVADVVRALPGPLWRALRGEVEVARRQAPTVAELADALRGGDWKRRLVAFEAAPAVGLPAGAALAELASSGDPESSHWARAALRELARARERAEERVCLRCFHRWESRSLRLGGTERVRAASCRGCGSAEPSVRLGPGGEVVALLDASAGERSSAGRGRLEVAWPAHRRPFDLDRVEVGEVPEDVVESFVIACGNDVDPRRRARYRSLPVTVRPGVELGARSRALLARVFGSVSAPA